MKRGLVILFLILLTSFPQLVKAQELVLVEPGMTPDNKFYFLDTLAERVQLLFTKEDEKVEKILSIIEEKVAEVEAMVEKDNEKAIERAKKQYEHQIQNALKHTEDYEGEYKENALLRIEEATQRHQLKLQEVLEKVPEQAKDAIQKVIEKSRYGHDTAVDAITKSKGNSNKNNENSEERID